MNGPITQAIANRQPAPATVPAASLAIRPGQELFDGKQLAALQVLGIKNATNADLAVFMHYCQKTGLDPFSRQIYYISRGGKWTIQVAIDGFRVIRDRIAARLGVTVEYEDTVWYDSDGAPHSVWLDDEPPAACRVTVLKDGKQFPGVVRTAAYIQTGSDGKPLSQWKTQPDHMIEKCAEAFALRRAFPHDLGGIYLEEELPPAPARRRASLTAGRIQDVPAAASLPGGDDGTAPPQPAVPGPAAPNPPGAAGPPARGKRGGSKTGVIQGHFKRLGFGDGDRDERLVYTAKLAGFADLEYVTSTDTLTDADKDRVIEALGRCKDRAALIDLTTTGEAPS